jgi:hypothetical protein
VRYLVKEFLKRCDVPAEDFELEELAYSGLSLVRQDFHIKIFKSINGEVPAPGSSKPRRRFYAQQQSFFAALAKEEAVRGDDGQGTLNLIVLWDFDKAHRLSNFWLVCPKAGGNSRESVEWHWHEQVPHVMEMVPEAETEPVGEDIPISKRKVTSVESQNND